MISRRGRPLLAACWMLAVLATPASAQHDAHATTTRDATAAGTARTPWVQIDLIVFRQLDTTSASNEQWPQDPQLGYPQPLRKLDEPTSDDAATTDTEASPATAAAPAFVQLAPSASALTAEAARIRASANYRLLAQMAWRQPAGDGSLTHLLVSGGAAHGEHHELEGSVTIRNLDAPEASLRLWLNDFADAADTTLQHRVALPEVPATITEREPSADEDPFAADDPFAAAESAPSHFGDAEPAVAQEPAYATRVVVLQATRQLSPGELHYVDHPLFGILLMATAVETAPQALDPGSAAPLAEPGDG